MRSTNKTKDRAAKSAIDYRACFTGGVFTTPIAFNPTADDIRRIKNIPDTVNINEPSYTQTIKGEEYRKVSLWVEFNPNEVLKLKKPQYADNVTVKYEIFVSDRDNVGRKSGKSQVIDTHNQTGWIKLSGKKSLQKQIEEAQADDSPYKPADPIRRIDAANARVAKQGEVALYELIFNMSTLDEHRPNSEDPAKGKELHEFKLGENPTETIENIFHGDLSSLRMLLATSGQDFEGKEYFTEDGANNPLGIFLGVSEDNGRLYQRVFSPFTVSPVSYMTTYRKTDRTHDYSAEKLEDSKLKPEAVRVLLDDEYPWDNYWNDSLKFQSITVEQYEDAKAPAATMVMADEGDDDLPF